LPKNIRNPFTFSGDCGYFFEGKFVLFIEAFGAKKFRNDGVTPTFRLFKRAIIKYAN